MIPTDRLDVLEAGIEQLTAFQRRSGARGRFIVLYLGLRRMGPDLARLGSGAVTATREIETAMDLLLTKRHRDEPRVVLTAPFGGTAAKGTYSARSGQTAPGNRRATNTWRNNLGIQKGIGCPADPAVIARVLDEPQRRLACPHIVLDPSGEHLCRVKGTRYRREVRSKPHSIWLRETAEGWQVVDLDHPAVYADYLQPGGERIPIFPLIGVLYCDAGAALPRRAVVGIPEFAADFHFEIEQVQEVFDCDPGSDANASILRMAAADLASGAPPTTAQTLVLAAGAPLPQMPPDALSNSGLGAELAVARELQGNGWDVAYRGGQYGIGFDLEATRAGERLCVEVKSSVSFTTPELTASEWDAAREHGRRFVLAIVDFYGSPGQTLSYVRDPAVRATPRERTETVYGFARRSLAAHRTGGDHL